MIFYIFLKCEILQCEQYLPFFGFYKKKKIGDLTKKNPVPLIFLTLKSSYFRTYKGQSPSETKKRKNSGTFLNIKKTQYYAKNSGSHEKMSLLK